MMKEQLNHKNAYISNFISENFDSLMHKKRVASVTNAVIGLLNGKVATISNIGRGLAGIKGTSQKHGIKQIDRLCSNEKFDVKIYQKRLTQLIVAKRKELLVAIDWTCFARDKHITLTAKAVTKHGRASPLVWLTVHTDQLTGRKVKYENILLNKLKQYLPEGIKVIILADREFGSIERFERLKLEYGFEYVIRFRKNTYVYHKGVDKKAGDWLKRGFSSRTFTGAAITRQQYQVNKIAVVRDKGMKDTWCLACSISSISLKTIKKYYNKRWSTECSYRDEKDIYFGFGLYKSRVKDVKRRDRLLAIIAIATIILTLLGEVSEKLGLDKQIKANTTKTRTHSLFTQGLIVFSILYNIEKSLRSKILRLFEKIKLQTQYFSGLYGVI